MADITTLIRADHDWFRQQFARLDSLRGQEPANHSTLERVWRPLADKLDVHAYIEEKIFYPQLLKRGTDDPEGETLDAIGDHNDIRDGVRDADAAQVGTEEWWAAVARTRSANDDHMREEERDGLPDFRRSAPIGLREALGRQYSEFMAEHPTTEGLSIVDRDPQRYVEEIEGKPSSHRADFSLRIGSLKGQ
ncbi:hemerythrin domain-containing protein [Mycobacterium terramassiliense]|uniref:Hemerythrin superfamily protein n=1 Tax=Mycobacterium terramassiliense TaxID=1841859 RepID=A0A2U3NE08_9MYCO|nr:hemerythrin domain-containing protein [Mycobacterium terramassiliense]SPM29713.1 Hemerythrin superfamily protein [Mycobacterium terramassiliense]